MFQSGYRVINMIGVGNIVSENWLGPPAGSFSIMFVLIIIAAGPSTATAVLVAQYWGAKNLDRLKLVVDTSLLLQSS